MLAVAEPMDFTDQQLIDQYFKLKSAVEDLDKEYKEKVAPFTRGMKAIQAVLHIRLNERNAKHTSVEGGTAFKVKSMVVKTVDKLAYLTFCFRHPDGVNLLTGQVSKEALGEFLDKYSGDAPPGVEVSWVETVQIRRA